MRACSKRPWRYLHPCVVPHDDLQLPTQEPCIMSTKPQHRPCADATSAAGCLLESKTSPLHTMRLLLCSSCSRRLSSAMAEAEKLLPMSRNVGMPPCKMWVNARALSQALTQSCHGKNELQ